MPHREGMPMPGAPAAPSRSAPPLPGPSGSSLRRAEMGRVSRFAEMGRVGRGQETGSQPRRRCACSAFFLTTVGRKPCS
eukprot:scaffold4936_cov73-Phaeocystis_antarctica.AAC.11